MKKLYSIFAFLVSYIGFGQVATDQSADKIQANMVV